MATKQAAIVKFTLPSSKRKTKAVDHTAKVTIKSELQVAEANFEMGLELESMQNLVSAYKKLGALIEKGGFSK